MSAWLGLHTFQHGIYDRIRTQPVTQRHGNAVTILILDLLTIIGCLARKPMTLIKSNG